jgi:hypothetical protein
MALAAAEGRFFGVVVTPGPDEGLSTLVLWLSDNGADWRLATAQPMLPADAMYVHHVAIAVAGDRLLLTASGEMAPVGDLGSIALLSPPVASMGGWVRTM